ncbi:MAG: aspartyl protease family protein [Spirochaetaceae bacterium]|jgi:clan AA aspartic protease|nr:aspartyl protease family protein [Spirochaetaceae bacterium]
MSVIFTGVTLENVSDIYAVQFGIKDKSEIRTVIEERALVDTGAWTLVINQEIADKLGLEFDRKETSEAAGGNEVEGYMAKPAVRVRLGTDYADVEAFVLPEEDEIVLGALPMEIMDLWISPRSEKLIPRLSKHLVKYNKKGFEEGSNS